MRSTNENTLSLPAWGVSFAFHGGVVWLAILFTAQVKPVITEEVFKWDVALVEPVKADSASEPMLQPAPMKQVVPTVQPPPRVTAPRPAEPPTDTVMHRVAPQQTAQMVHPEVQPPKPVEQREDPLPPLKTEPVTPPVHPVREKTAEPIEQPVVGTPKTPEPTTVAKEPEPVKSVEPLVTQQQPVASPSSEPAISRTVETPATPSVSEPVASSSAAEPPPATSAHSSPSPQEAPVQVAKAAPSGPEAKIDHRWIAESLWRRVAELKRYPSSARLNGQEGKVVLKAVIRSDGHLIEVIVQKSSGHQILDAAAIEAVKLACPLHMKHAINKPEIVVSLPIVYSLAN